MKIFLPEEKKKGYFAEYRIRAILVFIHMITFSVIVGLISLLPAYVSSKIKKTESSLDLTSISRNNNRQIAFEQNEMQAKKTEKILSNINLNGTESLVFFEDILKVVLSNKNKNIKIDTFEIAEPNSHDFSIKISGIAMTRESLVSFKNSLAKDSRLTKVEMPDSDLTKSKNIPYNINIFGKI